jgi:glycosyltransferase involved in cell wall biosynthesis
LGFEVEVVWFHDKDIQETFEIPHLTATVVPVKEQPNRISSLTRMLYFLGLSRDAILDHLFVFRKQAQSEVRKRELITPGAIHHFEYLDLASAAVGLPPGRYVWSNHDFDSERFNRIQEMRNETGKSNKTEQARAIQYKRMQSAEQWTSSACQLVLTIAEHETALFRRAWKGDHIHLLPMSWPDETLASRARDWMADGKLRLFHLGSLNSLVPFSSMRFILEEVFPLIPAELMERIEFWVVGEISEGKNCQTILRIASAWPQVRLRGYVEEIEPLFGQMDLQLVGSQFASGLRTRIIESFVRGLPVLSTEVAARGVVGLRHRENILLADTAETFAREIVALFERPKQLQRLSANAHETYKQYYGRDMEAKTLGRLLERHVL